MNNIKIIDDIKENENENDNSNTNEDDIDNINNIDKIEEMYKYQKSYKTREKIIFYEFLNFLEIYINNVLYLRNVYPKEAFYSYNIYHLNFLKFIADDIICDHIAEFLKFIENFLFARFINKIYILIIDADNNTILEVFNLEVDFADKFYDLNYEELCLNFKSILYKLYHSYINKISDNSNMINKTFNLCIETGESKVISSTKLYEEMFTSIEENFIKNLFKNDLIKLFEKREVCAILDETNFSLKLSRNFI
jgi:hypothetical protein